MSITLRTTLRTAKKPHVCTTCWRLIERGEQYQSTASVDDDGFWASSDCLECDQAHTFHWSICPSRGDYCDIRECLADSDDLRAALWLNGIRHRWRDHGVPIPVPMAAA